MSIDRDALFKQIYVPLGGKELLQCGPMVPGPFCNGDEFAGSYDPAGAEALLNEAIQKDPTNKVLFLTIGSIYIDLKQNEKAEEAFNKALAIDPEYQDALYQLGATLVNWGGAVIAKTNDMKYNDPKVKVLEKQSNEIFTRAIEPLEKYVAKNPNEKSVLTILSQLYRNLGNMEKSEGYKARAKAL